MAKVRNKAWCAGDYLVLNGTLYQVVSVGPRSYGAVEYDGNGDVVPGEAILPHALAKEAVAFSRTAYRKRLPPSLDAALAPRAWKPRRRYQRDKEQKPMKKKKKKLNLTRDTLPVLVRFEGKGQPNKPDWHLADLVAIFPTVPGDSNNPNSMQCYCVIGQHATCRSDYAGSTKPATPEQVTAMLEHLKGLKGYEEETLRPIARVSSHHRTERVRQLHR